MFLGVLGPLWTYIVIDGLKGSIDSLMTPFDRFLIKICPWSPRTLKDKCYIDCIFTYGLKGVIGEPMTSFEKCDDNIYPWDPKTPRDICCIDCKY